MFIPSIMSLGTKEQQDEWLPRAWDYKIIGSYVQTEIGNFFLILIDNFTMKTF